ncbi:MAG: hypothetical protein KatS3mg031_0169 [Chitinophagales bacterium]|nr:MAG: hypothetical protein KatS3mg031_0169 [Chitinophagales bacterium]
MKSYVPIQRDKALQPFSREHHHGLLLGWKIRTGLKKKVDPERIKKYCDAFYKYQLLPHFENEESYLFPVLGKSHPLVLQAIQQHRQLELLFTQPLVSVEVLLEIAELLDHHIRFEERVLFNELQRSASKKQLEKIAKLHPKQTPICTTLNAWKDNFWE